MMLIQNVELGSVLKIRGNTITFKDTNQFEEREYQVEQADVEELVWITGMDSEDAAMLLGKIEEIRIHGSPKKRLFKKIDSKKLIHALANIILEYNWQDIYVTLQEAKYHQIEEMCNANSPIEYYEEQLM